MPAPWLNSKERKGRDGVSAAGRLLRRCAPRNDRLCRRAGMIRRDGFDEASVKAVRVIGTENYAEEAPELLKRYESISFADTHRSVMHLIPTEACRVLDIGAGTGRDAAGFAAGGNRVVAVEPTGEMRRGAMALHPSPLIEWVDDSLPDLASVRARGEQFDVVMLTAVWMP